MLPGPIEFSWEADVLLGADRLERNVPLTNVQLIADGTAQVEGVGSCDIVRSPLRGESWIPEGPGDMLAPFGPTLAISAHVHIEGLLDEQIPYGVYPITAVPTSSAGYATVGGETIIIGESISLEFKDRMHGVVHDTFTRPTAPGTAPTCYAELERLTGYTVARTLTDRPIRAGIFYEKERHEAVEQIARILGGVPYFNPVGQLQIRRDIAGTSVVELDVDDVSPVTAALSTDGVYNGIVVTGKAEDGSEIRVEMWITQGPLSPSRWGRRVPKFYHSDYLYTEALVVAEAESQLADLSRPAARLVEFDMLPHPLLEVGDVVTLRQPSGAKLRVRLQTIWTADGAWRARGELLI